METLPRASALAWAVRKKKVAMPKHPTAKGFPMTFCVRPDRQKASGEGPACAGPCFGRLRVAGSASGVNGAGGAGVTYLTNDDGALYSDSAVTGPGVLPCAHEEAGAAEAHAVGRVREDCRRVGDRSEGRGGFSQGEAAKTNAAEQQGLACPPSAAEAEKQVRIDDAVSFLEYYFGIGSQYGIDTSEASWALDGILDILCGLDVRDEHFRIGFESWKHGRLKERA